MPTQFVGELHDCVFCVTYEGGFYAYEVKDETLAALSRLLGKVNAAFDPAADAEFLTCPPCPHSCCKWCGPAVTRMLLNCHAREISRRQ
jgi:hypothetical protein